jgi:hypothetical protein
VRASVLTNLLLFAEAMIILFVMARHVKYFKYTLPTKSTACWPGPDGSVLH